MKKKTGILLTLLAFVLATGMLFVSCKQNQEEEAIEGASDVPVTYPADLPAEAKNKTDFSYYINGGWGGMDGSSGYTTRPISDFINAPASVNISGGKVTIKLGVPKDEHLNVISEGMPPSITANPGDAKIFMFDDDFCTSDGNYYLVCRRDANFSAMLWYVDKDVTIKGTLTESGTGYDGNPVTITMILNLSLKKGWNYYFGTYNEATKTATASSSTTIPNGYTWTVINH